MKALLARVLGLNSSADAVRVIAIFGRTRKEIERAVQHAATAGGALPIWAWCEEPAEGVEGCARFVSGGEARQCCQDLRGIWPALVIVAWTGRGGSAKFKLLPFIKPPFRVVVQNEAGDFFPARFGIVASHIKRRLRDATLAGAQKLLGWYRETRDLGFAAGRRLRHLFRVVVCAVRQWGIYAGGFVHDVRIGTAEWLRDSGHYLYELGLTLLASLARNSPAMARSVVRNNAGRRHPGVKMEPAGSTFVEIRLRDRGWPRREVMRAIRESRADYIVFRRKGEEGDASGLLALATETNAFAAAKQVAFSHWRQRVLTKHPFRKLHEGEVTQVFAPSSTLLVMRRDAMEQLGCPRALTSGAALMVFFWKAAAAGLTSLVQGQGGEVTDEQAMVLEDAEFALQLATSRRMGSMGAVYPSRLRGNVASMPGLARPSSGRPRILVVSPYLPWPLAHGGAVRIYNLCRSLSGEVDFILACFREHGETVNYEKLHEAFREVYVVDADEKRPDPEVPAQVAEYRNSAMAELIRGFCLNRRVDLVQLEYTQTAEYRHQTGAIPVLLVEHDITFTLHRQFAEIGTNEKARAEYERWLTFEREALQCSNAVWTMSEQDREVAIQHGAPATSLAVIPNGVDLVRFQPAPKTGFGKTVLFVGSFRHLPNLLAFEALRESIMPEVWREFPEAVLHVIAGPQHERAAGLAGKSRLLEAHPRIRLEGFVEDVRPAYQGADVVAIPLPVSAGTNIKLMEAMACGRAIVSTRVGCQGLNLADGRDLLVADLGAGFTEAVIALLRDGALRARMADDARMTAVRRFGWDAIARDAANSYARLLERGVSVAAD